MPNLCLQEQDLTAIGVSGILRLRINKTGKDSTTAKILRNCKKMAQIPTLLCRRSFYAVGQSCVINLNPTQSQSGATPSPLNLVTRFWSHAVSLYGIRGTSHIRLKVASVVTKAVEEGGVVPDRKIRGVYAV